MLVVKDPLFDRGMVHDINTAKHQWCVSAAWLQIASLAVSLTLKALQVWDNYRKASHIAVAHSKHSKFSLLKVSTIVVTICLLYSSPVLHTMVAHKELPDVSQYCTFMLLTGDTALGIHVLLLVVLQIMPVTAILVGCYHVERLLKGTRKMLERFDQGTTHVKKRHNVKWQPVVKGILSACVILVSITTFCVVCFTPDKYWIHGVWFTLVFSIPAFSQPPLQFTTYA